jgi:hypothetical protein
MKHLVPCPECSRHVRVSENACPFCDAALELGHTPPPVVPNRRLSRVALLAFSATLAAGVGACGGDTDSDKGTGGSGGASGGSGGASGGSGGTTGGSAGSTGGDGGFAAAATLYGLPIDDAGASTGGSFPEGGVPVYGAPPPPQNEEEP